MSHPVVPTRKSVSSAPEVEILLATFNGDRFLNEQIDSILAQDYKNIRISARDDGSSDNTVAILNQYASRYPDRFRILPSNRGTGNAKFNFLRLIEASTADYICFSDQDDVWLPDKVSKTQIEMQRLESLWGKDAPLLVFTDLKVVDDKLTITQESFWAHMRIDPGSIDNFALMLVQSVVTGCTAMVNRGLLDLSLQLPEEASMHDRWVALLASAMGKSGAVKTPTVLYRQHDQNVLGAAAPTRTRSLLQSLWRPAVLQKHAAQWMASQRQAVALFRLHAPELTAEKRKLLEAYLRCERSRNPFVRIALFLRYGFYYAGIMPNLLTILHLCSSRRDEVKAL
jgi:hypothetical protein